MLLANRTCGVNERVHRTQRLLYLVCVSAAFLPGQGAVAHGTPIHIGLEHGALTAGGGLADSMGYAPQIFVEDGEDGDPFATLTLPGIGPVIIWDVPGVQITGLSNSSSLFLEALSRPVKGTMPRQQRTVWYWNPQSECVEPTSADLYLLGTGMRSARLQPAEEPPPPFLLASSLTGQQNFHNHGLMSYAVDNDPSAPAGAYGFFARFTSDLYAPSNPILLVFNRGVAYELMETAALAINKAAQTLDGDFNQDGVVDAADFAVWRKSIGSAPEYEAWRANFGAETGDCECGSSGTASAVPEPHGIALGIVLTIAGIAASRPRATYLRRCSSRARRFASSSRVV